MKKAFSRRSALCRALSRLSGFALAASGFPIDAPAQPDSGESAPEEEHFDVVVVGGGIGGLSAALCAAEEGSRVVLLEKNGFLGGDTLISGGTFNAVDPKRQRPLGIVDSYEQFESQMLASGEGYNDPAVVRVFAREATTALIWLEAHGMRFLPELTEIYGSGFVRAHRSAYPRGRGYIHCLSNACIKAGVDIRPQTRALSILRDERGAVYGVEAQSRERNRTANAVRIFQARRGVVLASGGFAANKALLAKYAPEYASLPIDSLPSSTGDMLLAADAIGADTVNLGFVECVPGAPPGIDYQVRLDYDAEDIIMVNQAGRRFVNETGTRREIASAVARESGPCYEIADQDAVDGMSRANQKSLWRGYFAKAAWKDDSPQALAVRLGISPQGLADEIGRAVADGRFAGPPYWGVRIHLRIHCTLGGLRIDENARVLDRSGQPIDGLWAAGAVTGNVHGINRLGANGINCACVFGRIAGTAAARRAPQHLPATGRIHS